MPLARLAPILSAAVLTLASAAAPAEPLPRMDADEHCRSTISSDARSGTPQEQYRRCFDRQQQAYDSMKAGWGTLTEEQQRMCVSRAGWGTVYETVSDCIDDIARKHVEERNQAAREAERKAIPRREFRY